VTLKENAVFPINIWFAYTAACLLLVLAPGPDNLLAVGRGLSQGRIAAIVSGMASGAGILFHVATASLGLTLLMQTSAVAFWVVKFIGAGYLLWLGIKVLRSRSLISFQPTTRQSLPSIFLTGLLSALTAVGFALMGVFATALSRFLRQRPRLVNGLNVGAGLTFVASGVSIAALSQK
jgi:threonine/homoserine/homoserine lactone efflux protein